MFSSFSLIIFLYEDKKIKWIKLKLSEAELYES